MIEKNKSRHFFMKLNDNIVTTQLATARIKQLREQLVKAHAHLTPNQE